MISNKQAICDTLLQLASEDRDILVLCSDSRGSASASGFAESLPGQFIELGIAEQNLVSVAAGPRLRRDAALCPGLPPLSSRRGAWNRSRWTSATQAAT